MAFLFTKDQEDRLKRWKESLKQDDAKDWYSSEEKASEEINKLLNGARFKEGNDLTEDQLDELFHLLRAFSNNRNLSNLLYRSGIKEFNTKLRNLFYGNEPFYKRVNDMFDMKGMGTQTVSQFLLAADPKMYPLITSQTKEALKIDATQEKEAYNAAMSKFGITNPEELSWITKDYLTYYVMFEKIKEDLGLDAYYQVNNLIWFGAESEGEAHYGTNQIRNVRTHMFVSGESFSEVDFEREEEFENEIESNAQEIFGSGTTYYPLKKKIGLRICDGLLFDRKDHRVAIIENEIKSHDLYGHIVPQIIDFFNGMRENATKNKLKHDTAWKDDEERHIIRAIDFDQYDIIVVIDKINFETKDAASNISRILTYFVNPGKTIRILFKEVNVYKSISGKKVFRVSNSFD